MACGAARSAGIGLDGVALVWSMVWSGLVRMSEFQNFEIEIYCWQLIQNIQTDDTHTSPRSIALHSSYGTARHCTAFRIGLHLHKTEY